MEKVANFINTFVEEFTLQPHVLSPSGENSEIVLGPFGAHIQHSIANQQVQSHNIPEKTTTETVEQKEQGNNYEFNHWHRFR